MALRALDAVTSSQWTEGGEGYEAGIRPLLSGNSRGWGSDAKQVCVPQIGPHFWASLENSLFSRGKVF